MYINSGKNIKPYELEKDSVNSVSIKKKNKIKKLNRPLASLTNAINTNAGYFSISIYRRSGCICAFIIPNKLYCFPLYYFIEKK